MIHNVLMQLPVTLKCKNNILSLTTPVVMGILNVTPNSFFDGGRFTTIDSSLLQTEKMLNEGASIIDIGGQSTQPKAADVGANEEVQRVLPVIEAIVKRFPECIISIDTYRSKVAEQAVNAGASIVNDISGGDMDALMFDTIARLQVPYLIMHIQGTPETMQIQPTYKNVITEVFSSLNSKVQRLRLMGVYDVIIDPGFGFGKTVEHNYLLLKHLNVFTTLGCVLMAGMSRKSMINKVLGTKPENALNGTTVLNTIALIKGAQIIRVHDVKEAIEGIKLVGMLT